MKDYYCKLILLINKTLVNSQNNTNNTRHIGQYQITHISPTKKVNANVKSDKGEVVKMIPNKNPIEKNKLNNKCNIQMNKTLLDEIKWVVRGKDMRKEQRDMVERTTVEMTIGSVALDEVIVKRD